MFNMERSLFLHALCVTVGSGALFALCTGMWWILPAFPVAFFAMAAVAALVTNHMDKDYEKHH